MDSMMKNGDGHGRIDIEFVSNGEKIRGWMYSPDDVCDKIPCVIMAHGFSAVKEQYLDRYAEVFASAGLGVIVFDHAGFGASGGAHPFEVDPERQRQGYRDAIGYARAVAEIDPDRIGLWGSSYAGGHVLAIAAHDRTIKAVVGQVPTISGSISAKRRNTPENLARLAQLADEDVQGRSAGCPPMMVDVVSEDPAGLSALPSAEAYRFFQETRSFAPRWHPQVTLSSMVMAGINEPAAEIDLISPTPLLMIPATDDRLTLPDLTLEAFEKAGEPKRVVWIEGGHFSPYVEHFETTSQAALDWFLRYL